VANDVYDYIESTGVITADANEIQLEVQAEYLNTFGSDLNIDPSTPQGMLITIETLSRIAVADNNVALANQINPNVAGGVFLDALMQLLGLQRIPASHSKVDCTITGVVGTSIPAGAQISNDDGSVVFEIVSLTVIPTGGILLNVPFQSVSTGAIPAPANTLTTIVSNILGWETVTNPLAATQGASTQSDTQARILRQNALGAQGNSIAANVIAALYMIPGVSQSGVTFQENVSSTPQTINDILMVPHSIYAVVGGTASLELIASALTYSKSAGAAYNNGLGIPISYPFLNQFSNQIINVLFDLPSLVNISIQVTVHAFTTVQNVTSAVQNAIIQYATGNLPGQSGFVVGAAVSPFQLAAAINILVPGLFVQEIQVGVESFTQQGVITNGANTVSGLTYNAPISPYVGIQIGMTITDSGGNIPTGTTVATIVGSHDITMSGNAVFSSFNLQGTITSGLNTVTGMNSNSGVVIGMGITGAGIPGSTTVVSLVGSTGITMSANATISGTETLTFTPALAVTLTDILKFTTTPIYQTTEIPIGVWQQAITSAPYISVSSV
jgi:uncharacterized phage protein gp47/JayE